MNREVHYEGWLIKSPPTKRIWRARWRRRWFTLKQGEIPEQFCLEYYTDRNCRKLKGVIDLDQCEQVDCGLRLENRKQKFQFMFDIKTPKRTYYLAADTEADMRDWVNCICQVCHLHDTKQSNELQQDENRTHNTALTNSTQNTTTTSLNSSSSTAAATTSSTATATATSTAVVDTAGTAQRQSFCNDILRRANASATATVVDQQPRSKHNVTASVQYQNNNNNNNSDCAYVNTEYTNRETVLCDARFDQQQLAAAIVGANGQTQTPKCSRSPPTTSAVYLNTSVFQTQTPPTDGNGRLVVSANGVIRKIPESLVLNNTPLPETQQHSVQPSPALSTSSGPYIPISECFSGSPKFIMDSNNPTTPLNNLDPKFYDTPRCHNNIGLNLTNDQSYSPKITNCSSQQIAANKNRSHRSDSDSESVFTDDDEWTHPLPLRENVDRSTRPSDSSVENESFVLTYSQRFSKMPDDNGKLPSPVATAAGCDATTATTTTGKGLTMAADPLEKLAKMLKNKNNLILDFKENEKLHRDMPQLSDTENTSPAIGPLDSSSVVEENYDIPRSQNLPYYNMAHLFDKVISPQANPIAASTPNLMAGTAGVGGSGSGLIGSALGTASASRGLESIVHSSLSSSPATVRTLPRQHCYTNAAPSKVEGTVFRYDFIEQSNLPPVNRKLKPKVQSLEDRPPEEVADKPPVGVAAQQNSPKILENLTNKLMGTNLQSPTGSCGSSVGGGGSGGGGENSPLKPPSVDRKLKPNAYKFGASGASLTMAPSSRRSGGAPLSMVLPNDRDAYVLETRTLPRHPPLPIYSNEGGNGGSGGGTNATGVTIQHQRTASAAAAMQFTQIFQQQQQQQQQQQHQLQQQKSINEHKLQYFDLDVANPPPINRQSMSVGNLYAAGSHRMGLSADPLTRGPVKSGVVYNYVDFVKTEAFKRIREERKKESEGVSGTAGSTSSSTSTANK